MTLSPAQFQQACDLINNNERTDAVAMKCKVGKPCNGRCIPQNHKCVPTGGLKTTQGQQPKAPARKGLTTGQKVALGIAGGYVGLEVAAAAARHHLNTVNEAGDKEYQEHLNKHPEEKATYEKAKAAAKEKYGEQGSRSVHKTLKDNWQRQNGVPDQTKPKVKDWHKTLGVSKNASPEEIKKAYREMSRKNHPDKGGNANTFNKINEAYEASKRKDALDVWQSIESAYQAAQQHHSRVDSSFWNL